MRKRWSNCSTRVTVRVRSVFECPIELVEQRSGFIAFLVDGTGFAAEAGGHRWQRVPPNERHSRVHTSTVTVSVLPLMDEPPPFGTVRIETTRGDGPGGQHRNKTDSCVVATHVATGLQVRIDGRSQFKNKQTALRVLSAKVAAQHAGKASETQNSLRAQQIGSGMRGDKIKTYRERDDLVIDHVSGQKSRLSDWRKGRWF